MGNIFTKKRIIISIIVLAIIGGIAYGFIYLQEKNSGKLAAKETLKEIGKVGEELQSDDSGNLKDKNLYSKDKIYDVMHRMSNTKIVAKDNQIWGTLPMNKKDIQKLKSVIEKVDYSDRKYMLEVLERWENGDFSKAVSEHNYFWEKLGGTIGKAVGLKD